MFDYSLFLYTDTGAKYLDLSCMGVGTHSCKRGVIHTIEYYACVVFLHPQNNYFVHI